MVSMSSSTGACAAADEAPPVAMSASDDGGNCLLRLQEAALFDGRRLVADRSKAIIGTLANISTLLMEVQSVLSTSWSEVEVKRKRLSRDDFASFHAAAATAINNIVAGMFDDVRRWIQDDINYWHHWHDVSAAVLRAVIAGGGRVSDVCASSALVDALRAFDATQEKKRKLVPDVAMLKTPTYVHDMFFNGGGVCSDLETTQVYDLPGSTDA